MNLIAHRVVLAAAALLTVGTPALWQYLRTAEPDDVCQAAEACDRMGLYWSTGAPGIPEPVKGYSSLTISTEPITTEEAGKLFVGADAERWRGKARAYSDHCGFGPVDHGLQIVAWGNLTLVGDPDLVNRLVGRR